MEQTFARLAREREAAATQQEPAADVQDDAHVPDGLPIDTSQVIDLDSTPLTLPSHTTTGEDDEVIEDSETSTSDSHSEPRFKPVIVTHDKPSTDAADAK